MDNKGEKKIQFKPLHSGVGFHPFSDGLPYAPQSKAVATPKKVAPQPAAQSVRTSAPPAGAVAAGRPIYAATPRATSQKISPKNEVEVMGGTQSSTIPSPVVSSVPLTTREKVFSFLFDASIHAIAWLLVVWVMRIGFESDLLIEIVRAQPGILLTAYCVSQWIWIRLPQTVFGRSAGQAFFS